MIKLEKITKDNFHNLPQIISSWWDEKTCQEISEDLNPNKNQDWASFSKRWFVKNENNKYIGITGITGLTQSKFRNTSNEIWLGWFCIQDIYRGKNYGKKALIETIKKAKEYDFEILRIESQPTKSKTANKLYQSAGFLKEKYIQEPKFLNDKTYIFSKALKKNINIKIGNKNFQFMKEYGYNY